MDYQIKDYKEEFLRIYNENVKREGADRLLDWLQNKSDFFTAPASTRFHSAFEGGLCSHSVKTYYRFVQNLDAEYDGDWETKISAESVAIIALLHDLCKVDYYKVDYRNVKNQVTGDWEQKPYYSIEDSLPYGHGEKSVYMLCGFIRLSREEAIAINWHMGGFDKRVLGGDYAMSDAFYKYPTALLFHISDTEATYLDETVTR
jgi:hypothetical protein